MSVLRMRRACFPASGSGIPGTGRMAFEIKVLKEFRVLEGVVSDVARISEMGCLP